MAQRLLLHVADDLVAVSLLVLAAADVDPEVFAIGSFDDGLVEVRVGDEPVEPLVENLLVGVGKVIVPIGIGGLWELDVSGFTKGVLAGVCTTDFDVQGIAAVA